MPRHRGEGKNFVLEVVCRMHRSSDGDAHMPCMRPAERQSPLDHSSFQGLDPVSQEKHR